MTNNSQTTKPDAEFFIEQDGMIVAEGCGPIDMVVAEAFRYMRQYMEDGALELKIKVNV
jgi:hypothetical protein